MNRLRLACIWLIALCLAACVPIRAGRPPTPTANPTPVATVARPQATATRQPVATPTSSARATPTPTPATAAAAGLLRAYFLDVGQGDSILLKGPDFTILIDTGRHDRDDVVPYLQKYGVTSIDLLIGTHPHADHIGQFAQVLQTFPVTEVWMSGDANTTKNFEEAIDAIAASGAAYYEPRAGEVYQIGSAHIQVLNPDELTGEYNEGSVSLRLAFGDIAFMFTGDAEAVTERAILERGYDLHAQILKLGHHGSNTSSSPAFLEAVRPEVAIWSAGPDNTYGHPSPEVIKRLQEMGVTVLGTAINSTITVITDGKTYRIEASGPINAAPTSTPRAPGCAPGQIDINTAPLEELEQITQVGPARARQIIRLRPFTSVDDLTRATGIGEGVLAEIKAQGLACVN